MQAIQEHEGELQADHRHLQALVDTSPVGIVIVEGPAQRVVLFNKEAQRLFGFTISSTEPLSQYAHRITFYKPDGTLCPVEERPLERALLHGEATRAEEMLLEFPDGRRLPVLLDATPVSSDSGEITGAIGIFQDITPMGEIERLRSEFLGMVSHELKTPLTAIKGAAATVLGSKTPFSPEETRELFEIIDQQADRLRDLMDNILDMSRIEAGVLSVSTEPMSLQEVLQDAKTAFARSGNPQGLHIKLAEGIPQVNADRRRIAQVLTNLLSNAVKFSPPTAPIIIEVEHDAAQVTVQVQDKGRGIPVEKMPQLFKKFSKLHDESGPGISGTGLGLAICKGIVEAHGGRIWANSPGEGKGATFTFTLPIAAKPASRQSPTTAQRAGHVGRVRRTGERTRILAVDDEPEVLRYLQRSLGEAGYQAIITTDSSQVAKLVETEEPDLVLLDLLLPQISGFELLRRIREFSGVPVIFLTASSRSEDEVRALRMGADDYVTKPFSSSELLARVEAVLRRRVLPDQMEVKPPFVLDDLKIGFAERRVTVRGKVVSLSATEYKLLYELATHGGRVLTHEQILQRVWGPEYSGETELIRSFIRNLRHKLGDDARRPRYILTERQVGYRMPSPAA